MDAAPRCSARSKQTGRQCKRTGAAVCESCGVCRSHGCNCKNPGGAPKGSRNALKHGIYAVALREAERELWHEVPVGTLDDEIRLAKLQLLRALQSQAEVEAPGAAQTVGMELSEIALKAGTGPKGPVNEKTVRQTRPDYREVVYRLLGRIGELETKRAALHGAGGTDPHETARLVQEALEAMDAIEDAA